MRDLSLSGPTVALAAAVLLAVLLVALWATATANRLDRLHVRTDAAWLALEAALGRRAVVARTLARAGHGRPEELGRRATTADAADRAEREDAENALSAALRDVPTAQLSPELAAELADAQARVLLARRFHNDAVRDTAALRSRFLVRRLRLGGTAATPAYFEIAEQGGPAAPPRRPATRVLLLDPDDRVLLLRAAVDGSPDVLFWVTTGGGVEPGESVRAAGVREVAEETGLVLAEAALRGPLWRRRAVFEFEGRTVQAEEDYFAAAVDVFTPDGAGMTTLEQRTVSDARWCGPAEIEALDVAGETVYPPGLAQLLTEAVAVVRAPTDITPPVRTIG